MLKNKTHPKFDATYKEMSNSTKFGYDPHLKNIFRRHVVTLLNCLCWKVCVPFL